MMWSFTTFRMSLWQIPPMLTQNPYSRSKELSQVHSDRGEIAYNTPCALDDTSDARGIEVECEEIRNANSSVQLLKVTVSKAECPTESKPKSFQSGGNGFILGSE